MALLIRRWLLALTLPLALLLPACVEITNPQFDARYQPKRTFAVFAVWNAPGSPDASVETRADRLLVADIARPSSVVSIPLAGASAVSDVAIVDARPRVLIAEDRRIAEVDLLSRRISVVASLAPGPQQVSVRALGAAYAKDGALVSWYETAPGMGLTLVRRSGSREQSASAPMFKAFEAAVPFQNWDRHTWSNRGLMFLAADERYAYLVNSWPLPGALGAGEATSVWRADFSAGTIAQLGDAHTWPRALSPADRTHADRAMRRWGIPAEGPGGAVDFLSLTGGVRAAVSNLPTSNAGTVVFQPGGERYVELRPEWVGTSSIETLTVLAGSLGQTPTVVMERRVRGRFGLSIFTLGMVGDVLAYSSLAQVPGGNLSYPAGGSLERTLHFYNTRTSRDTTVTTLPGVGQIDYLGSYTH